MSFRVSVVACVGLGVDVWLYFRLGYRAGLGRMCWCNYWGRAGFWPVCSYSSMCGVVFGVCENLTSIV